jgi:hypothetical protein
MNMRTETEGDRGEGEEKGGKKAGFAWRALLVQGKRERERERKSKIVRKRKRERERERERESEREREKENQRVRSRASASTLLDSALINSLRTTQNEAKYTHTN